MKRITSFLTMLVLCCLGTFAQEQPDVDALDGWLIRIGAVQTEMVPGRWYFVHTPRNQGSDATDYAGENGIIQEQGGLIYDKGTSVNVSAKGAITALLEAEGASGSDHKDKLVRFVAVEGQEGAYSIQFGTGNWIGEAPGSATVSNKQYIAGLAGKYNFYPVKLNGTPNTIGRFGWNKYNMANRVDNNGANDEGGNGVVFWEEGELTSTAASEADIKGNNVWEIFDVEFVNEQDPYETTLSNLQSYYYEVADRTNFISDLKNGVGVGSEYGNYRPENRDKFLEYFNRATEVLNAYDANEDIEEVKAIFATVEEFKAFIQEFKDAEAKLTGDKVPLAVKDIVPGYYTLTNPMKWKKTENVYYTQEEADDYNNMNGYQSGDEGFVTTESVKEEVQLVADPKGLAVDSKTKKLVWGPAKEAVEFLWKVEKVSGSETKYRLINMDGGLTFNGVPTSGQVDAVKNDTATVFFDFRNTKELPVPGTNFADNEKGKTVTVYSIRNSHQGSETSSNYLHCGGHNSGAGESGNIVGWTGDPEASLWYLTAIDDETADEWINGDAAKVRRMVLEANAIAGEVPAQFEIAKDLKTIISEEDSVVTDAGQFYSQYTTADAQKIDGVALDNDDPRIYEFLIDGNGGTYWHSDWAGGNQPWDKHYLQISANEPLEGLYAVKLTRRNNAEGDHITKLAVKGYMDEPTDETTFEEGEDLGVITLPVKAKGETVLSTLFEANGCNYVRFYSEATGITAAGGGSNRGYWHAAEFNVFKAEQSTIHAKTQYTERKAIIERLQAAMDAWNAAEYDAENGALINDEAFNAAYNELVAANNAWKAVFVDPTALRNAIDAAPAANIFVEGTDPGYWKNANVAPTAVVEAAKAYDENAVYTPAESEQHIKAIADATASAFDAAIKIETGKWYQIKFATEETYENFGWDKTGAQASEHEASGFQQYPELFGKTAAIGKPEYTYEEWENEKKEGENKNDTLKIYAAQPVEEAFNGQQIFFFDDIKLGSINPGDDLFRFIEATDSSYIIQHKSTGLFLRGGQPATLSYIPSYFSAKALGAGENLITYTDVLGQKAQHCNLHGERSTNRLVCWEASTLGSNSGLYIHAVENVTEEPATDFTHKLWPGTIYAYTIPVDVTIKSQNATAYGVDVEITAEATTINLKKIEAETIKAATPFLMIADLEGEYITPADRQKEIKAEIVAADATKCGIILTDMANDQRDTEYAKVEMHHGMAVDTLQKGNGALVGTLRSQTIKAGKGIVANNNSFKHLLVDTNSEAYGAYIQCDLDPEGDEVLGTISIVKDGSIEVGIDQVLDTVAKGGNIYSVDGKLVGKGNINSINRLPAGIYVVNGVKVIKK